MADNQLQLAHDDGDPDWFVLRELDAATGQQQVELSLPSKGFALEQLGDALLATGWVRRDDGHLLLQRGTTAAALRDLVGEMFAYFIGPATPTRELLEIRAAVNAFDAVQESDVELPLFACAWLDIMVRDDLAESARSTANLWKRSHLEIGIEEFCQRRVEQLIARYQGDSTDSSGNRLAPSTRQRLRNDQASKLG